MAGLFYFHQWMERGCKRIISRSCSGFTRRNDCPPGIPLLSESESLPVWVTIKLEDAAVCDIRTGALTCTGADSEYFLWRGPVSAKEGKSGCGDQALTGRIQGMGQTGIR